MAEPSHQERTESATPRRREQARREGQVVKSREIVSTSLFMGNLLFFSFAGVTLFQQMLQLTQQSLAHISEFQMSIDGIYQLFLSYIKQISWMLLPLFFVLLILAVASNILQSGVIFSDQALVPKFSRISPAGGFKRIFSLQAVNELFKSIFKIGIIGYIAYASISSNFEHFFPLSQQAVEDIAGFLGQKALRLGMHTSYGLIMLAILDYGFQRWQFEKDLRMSPQEIKEERKETEGDPQIKARVRSVMREMAQKRMMEEVPKADVVVTNPTHLAVALRYRQDEMAAPTVIAKGADFLAERIKEVAIEHGIPLVENRPVAQHLFHHVDIGSPIPDSLYKAVAEILAYVYRIKPPVIT